MQPPILYLNLDCPWLLYRYMTLRCLWPAGSAHFLSHIPVSHPQPSVLIVSYIESAKAAAQFGFYQKAEWKPDDSMIAVAVSAPHCCMMSNVQFDQCSLEMSWGIPPPNKRICSLIHEILIEIKHHFILIDTVIFLNGNLIQISNNFQTVLLFLK